MRIVMLTLAAWLTLFATAPAQPSCGDPPRVDDQTLKTDLEGKAKLLSNLVGNASLKGQIDTTRVDIFSKYPNAGAAHSDTYLEYMFCSFVLTDPKLSGQENSTQFGNFGSWQPSLLHSLRTLPHEASSRRR